MNPETKTILLVHGLWMTPLSWDGFCRLYEDRGYKVLAPAWPGLKADVNEVRRNPSSLAGLGLCEITSHYEKLIRSLQTAPILMGHSMGGLIVQLLLDRGLGIAGVSIDGTAPRGVLRLPFSVLRAARPVLLNPFNYWRCKMLTFEQFQYAFANALSEPSARSAYDANAIPGPCRPIFEAAFANFNPWTVAKVNHGNNARAPLLLIAGADDNLVPPILNRINYRLYQRSTATTAYKEFPGRSHLIIAQDGWQEVADYALSWVEAQLRSGTEKRTALELSNHIFPIS